MSGCLGLGVWVFGFGCLGVGVWGCARGLLPGWHVEGHSYRGTGIPRGVEEQGGSSWLVSADGRMLSGAVPLAAVAP